MIFPLVFGGAGSHMTSALLLVYVIVILFRSQRYKVLVLCVIVARIVMVVTGVVGVLGGVVGGVVDSGAAGALDSARLAANRKHGYHKQPCI